MLAKGWIKTGFAVAFAQVVALAIHTAFVWTAGFYN
jgi:hypothetical protein